MKKPNTIQDLDQKIAELELKATEQKKDLKETFDAVAESLKPLNLVKSGVRSVFSGEHKVDLLNTAIGLGSGFLGRKLIFGPGRGIVGKTVSRGIEWLLAGVVSKNAEKIKEVAGDLIDKVFKKNKTNTNHSPANLSEREKTAS